MTTHVCPACSALVPCEDGPSRAALLATAALCGALGGALAVAVLLLGSG